MQNKVKILDIGNGFWHVMDIDFNVASVLNVGDSIHPDGTGFSFIVKHRYLSLNLGTNNYELTINVVEYETPMRKFKRKVFGIIPYGYWDYYKSKRIINLK